MDKKGRFHALGMSNRDETGWIKRIKMKQDESR